MATYKEIFDHVLAGHGLRVGGNDIAAAKEAAGIAIKMAHNRIDPTQRVTDTPNYLIDIIIEAMKSLGMNKPK